MSKVATLTSRSQITIPAEIRRRLGIGPGDKVLLYIDAGQAVLRPLGGRLTDFLEGLGREVWTAEGRANVQIGRDRGAWEDA
ncbi:MAG: AbrB/MazE/SpoVT family DNA-binding domain-containing protein [Deltaproteobacteria bacterium]|nr:AbrB/MazE/SpoVT family DNA-binding domain-containing protein [Deltaproteobacteria bacterium]